MALVSCGRLGYDATLLDVPVDAQGEAGDASPGACTVTQVVDNRPLSVGYRHACMVRAGQIWCWGDNEFGQLGIGEGALAVDQPVPMQVGTSDEWVAVVAGLRHTCALDCRRGLWCWGGNDRGQLGNTTAIPGADSPVPVRVPGSKTWANLFAGRNHTCAVDVDGGLWCWGANGAAQLGIGTQGGAADTGIPTQVVMDPPDPGSDNNWQQAGPGDDHTCALKTDGSMWCWGSNANGQLGQDGGPVVRSRPNRVADMQSFATVTSGLDASCALDGADALFCWGRNTSGQLGTDGIQDEGFPRAVRPGVVWQDLSFGYEHVCGIQADGSLWCWGANAAGALGLGDTAVGVDQLAPVQVGTETWEQVSVAQDYSCGIRAGEVWCWGEGAQGNLGNGSTDDLTAPNTVVTFP